MSPDGLRRWQAKAIVPVGDAYYILRAPGDTATAQGADGVWLVNEFDPVEYERYWKMQVPARPLLLAAFAHAEGARPAWAPDFEALATRSIGARRVGVLRMDVDSLGAVFSRGLPSDDGLLVRLAALSWNLNLFFKGYLNVLCRGKDVSIVYGGGDDLFIVGAASQVVELALEIRSAFEQFVGQNPSMTVSAGIAIFDSHFPLYLMAKEAGRVLKLAKEHPNGVGRAKNAATLFEVTLGWDDVQRALEDVAGPIRQHFASFDPGRRTVDLQVPRRFVTQALEIARLARKPSPRLSLPALWWMLGRAARPLRAQSQWRQVEQALLEVTPAAPGVVEIAMRWLDLLSRRAEGSS